MRNEPVQLELPLGATGSELIDRLLAGEEIHTPNPRMAQLSPCDDFDLDELLRMRA